MMSPRDTDASELAAAAPVFRQAAAAPRAARRKYPDVRRHIAEHFRGRAPDHENRAAAHYWERKRRLVLELLASHLPELRVTAPADADGSSSARRPLFVDVGCGDATDLFLIASYFNRADPGWRFVGLEGYASFLDAAMNKNATYGIAGVEFASANIVRPLPLGDRSVDVLYCSEVLEHIPDPSRLLAEFARIVRPGAFVLITTPNEPNVFQRSWWSRAHYEALKARTRRTAHERVEVNGELIDIYGHISLHSNHEWDRIAAEQGLIRADYRRGAAFYGGQRFFRWAGFHQARIAADWLLDLLPRPLSRNLSDQVIALYRRA